jgi:hypothetical protein
MVAFANYQCNSIFPIIVMFPKTPRWKPVEAQQATRNADESQLRNGLRAGRKAAHDARAPSRSRLRLCENLPHNIAVDVRQPVIAPLEAIDEPGVVEAELMEDGGLEVVDVNLVAGDGEAELVGFAV